VSNQSNSCAEAEILLKRGPGRSSRRLGIDKLLAATVPYFSFIAGIFVLIIGYFHYTDQFNEGDLYRVLLGLLNGQASDLWFHDPSHYGMRFGYGYVAMIYWLGELHAFNISNRESLIEAINTIGFLASVTTVGFLMASLRAMYDAPTALIASAIFILSPLFLETASSGHPLLIALAFFFAANFLLVLDIPARWATVSHVAATLLLFVGLTMRAELPLAFCWLAFAQRPRATLTPRQYILGVISRCSVCLTAFALFQIVYSFEVYNPLADRDSMSGVLPLIRHFYSLRLAALACPLIVVGSGIATVVVGAAAVIVERNRIVRHLHWPDAILSGANWLGPVSLILIGTMFWAPNSLPARHFTFVVLGIAVLIALWIARRFRINNAVATAVGLAIFFANQAFAEVVRPLVLRYHHSVYVKFPEHNPTSGVVPLGSVARYHADLSERSAVLTDLGRLITGSCEPRVLILTSNGPLMAGLMLKPNADARVSSERTERKGTYIVLKVLRHEQTFLFVDPQEIWPQDPVSVILNDPNLDAYQILRDPYSMSAADKLAVPADRMANYPAPQSGIPCAGEHKEAN
jgi:hypothetical protein